MKKIKYNNQNQLRSKKVIKIIETPPHIMIRWGTVIIIVVFFIIMLALYNQLPLDWKKILTNLFPGN